MAELRFAYAPESGLWRLGRGPNPLDFPTPLAREELDRPDVGNRFDSALGTYSVLYFATAPIACFGETLSRYRPDLELVDLVRGEWEDLGFMVPGHVPAEWRQRRLLTHAALPTDWAFLDVEDAGTRAILEQELASVLAHYGHEHLDIDVVRGGDRRVTRFISQWAYEQEDSPGSYPFAGIRYLSKLSTDWECWAVFEGVPIDELRQQPVLIDDANLRAIKELWNLVIH